MRKSVFFLFVLLMIASKSVFANPVSLEWMLEKAIRITNYKEHNELVPVFTQLAQALEQESSLSKEDMSTKLLYYADSVRGFVSSIETGATPYGEMSAILNKIKILLSVNNIYFLMEKNDLEFSYSKDDLIFNLESIISAGKAIKMDLEENSGIISVLNEVGRMDFEKHTRNKQKKIKKELKVLLSQITTKV